MAQINKIITGYVIQVFDTEEKRYVSQEFVQLSWDEVEYEDAENGDVADNSWTQFVPDLPTDMIQPE